MRKNIWWILAIAVVLCAAAVQGFSGGGVQTIELSATMSPAETAAAEIAETPEPSPTEADDQMVWIPVNGGTKYHSTPTCSGMADPQCVTISEAAALGYEPCGRCM